MKYCKMVAHSALEKIGTERAEKSKAINIMNAMKTEETKLRQQLCQAQAESAKLNNEIGELKLSID